MPPYFKMLLLSVFLFTGCTEKNSNDAREVYRLWSLEDPPEDVKLIRGKYWQSPHFTKEYIMHLELIAPSYWRNEFVKQNNLIRDTTEVNIPPEAPSWFRPGKNYKVWKQSGFSQGSKYYEDTMTGRMFIYEIQL